MADLIDGKTGHQSHAPLSHAQTVAISRHLQEQIRALNARMDEMGEQMQDTLNIVNANKDGKEKLLSELQDVKDDLAATKTLHDSTRKELGRTNGTVQKLQGGLELAVEQVGKLGDSQRVTNNAVQKVAQDLAQTDALAKKLRDEIERRLDSELGNLKAELDKTNLELKQLRADEEMTKVGLQEERQALRETNLGVKEVKDDLVAAKTKMDIIEQRLGDTATNLKTTRQNLEDLNTVTLKLHEDHEETKLKTAEVLSGLRKVGTHVKQVHEGLEKTANSLVLTQGKLDNSEGNIASMSEDLNDVRTTVQSLKEGQAVNKNQLASLHREIAEVGATTNAVKAGLKETSSILLPNINMDHTESRTAAARHGSLLQTAPTFMSGQSPRKQGSKKTNGAPVTSSHHLAWT